jgi:hypothetical protein
LVVQPRAIKFVSKFSVTYNYDAKKQAKEQSWWDKVTGWVTGLFGGKEGQAASFGNAVWEKLEGGTAGQITLSAAISPDITPCKDGEQKLSVKCYLRLQAQASASGKAQGAGGGSAGGSVDVSIGLPFDWAKFELGTCECDDENSLVLVFPGMKKGAFYVSSRGLPQLGIADLSSSTAQFSPISLPTEVALTAPTGTSSESRLPPRRSAGVAPGGTLSATRAAVASVRDEGLREALLLLASKAESALAGGQITIAEGYFGKLATLVHATKEALSRKGSVAILEGVFADAARHEINLGNVGHERHEDCRCSQELHEANCIEYRGHTCYLARYPDGTSTCIST